MSGMILSRSITVDDDTKCLEEKDALNGWWWTDHVEHANDASTGEVDYKTWVIWGVTRDLGATEDDLSVGLLGDP